MITSRMVVLLRDIPSLSLQRGDIGVLLARLGSRCCVEFTFPSGRSVAEMLDASNISLLRLSDVRLIMNNN